MKLKILLFWDSSNRSLKKKQTNVLPDEWQEMMGVDRLAELALELTNINNLLRQDPGTVKSGEMSTVHHFSFSHVFSLIMFEATW